MKYARIENGIVMEIIDDRGNDINTMFHKDIVSQLSTESLGDAVWMSHRILNDDGSMTLDDMTLEDISHLLGCPLSISNDSFLDLIKGLYHA